MSDDTMRDAKTVTYGPQVTGSVRSGRDTNTATHLTITNAESSVPPVTPPVVPDAAGPLLRLWLETPDGHPLPTLTINQEAVLRAGVVGAETMLPALDLLLEADGVGVEWPDDTRRRLLLRPGTAVRPARWTVVPTQTGTLTLRVLALVAGTLIQQLALSARCGEVAPSGVLAGTGAPPEPPAVTVPVGFALTSAPALPTHANALTLVIDQEREGYRLRLIEGGSVTACPLALTPTGVADLLASARTELLAVVHLRHHGIYPYTQRTLTIAPPLAEQTLTRLAHLGAYLWQALFAGPGSSADSIALGERLRTRSQAGSLHITVTAAHLPFPWALLYDRDPQQAITAEGFWGFRHVLTTLPTSGRIGPQAGDLALGPAAHLRALLALNLTLDQHQSVVPHTVIPQQRQTFADLGVQVADVTTEAALRDTLACGTDADLVYLYGHIISEAPADTPVRPGSAPVTPGVGSTRLVLTHDQHALTLRDLQLAAPLSRAPLLRRGPLVILNACGSASLSPLTYDGLVPYLLDLGARAVIGSECDVPIFFGAAFGSALVTAVVRDRLTVGAALRATRRQMLAQHQNALGLLYGVYGSADLAVADHTETARSEADG